MNILIRQATAADFSDIMTIWERAVKATHHFLAEDYFEVLKKRIPEDFLPHLKVFVLEEQAVAYAFFAVSADNLEMLFVDPAYRGRGLGTKALHHAIHILGVLKVDVNEQNTEATGFYLKAGYKIAGRSPLDGLGEPYPLLHLEYRK